MNTGVFGTGWSFTTTMLVRDTLPVLATVPEKRSGRPDAVGCAGQDLVTRIPGVSVFWQTRVVELVTVRGLAVNSSTPRAVRTAVLGLQGSEGIQLPEKLAACPKPRFVMKATWISPPLAALVTVTPTSVLLPQLVTVPVKVMAPFSSVPPKQRAEIRMQGWLTSVLTPWSLPPRLLVSF